MAIDVEKTYGPLALKVIGWVAPVLAGALLMLLLNVSGDRRQQQLDAQRIERLEMAVKDMQTAYATNKRVDDLQAEMRSNYHDLSTKLDNVLKILIENSRR